MDEKAFTEVQVSKGEVPARHWKEEKKKKSGHMRVGKRSFASITPPHKVPRLREKAGWQSLPWGKGESSESVPS